MSMSYLALNEPGNVPDADMTKKYLVEWMIVAENWEIYAPTPSGNVRFRDVGEGEKFKVSLQGDKLERVDKEAMIPPSLLLAISQVIRDSPRVGWIWFAHCGGTPKFLFTLRSAADAETQELNGVPCFWYRSLARARHELSRIKGEPKTTYNHHGPFAEQEMSAISKADHVFKEYSDHLTRMAERAEQGLERERAMKQPTA